MLVHTQCDAAAAALPPPPTCAHPPDRGPAMAAAPPRPSLAGFLLKKGEGRLLGGGWKRRYFALRGRELQYAAAEGDPPRGAIDLAGASVVTIGRTGLAIEGVPGRDSGPMGVGSGRPPPPLYTSCRRAQCPAPLRSGGFLPGVVFSLCQCQRG